MYLWVLIAHSDWRWVVVIAGFAVLLRAVITLSSDGVWGPGAARLARVFSISLDIQVLIGAALYLSLSPLTTTVLSATDQRLPSDSQPYFFVMVHPAIMVAAFIAVHIAPALVRRGRSDAARARRVLIFYGIPWLLVLSGIPWWGRPWVRL